MKSLVKKTADTKKKQTRNGAQAQCCAKTSIITAGCHD